MSLNNLQPGEKFSDVSCILRDFRKGREHFDLVLCDKETVKAAYMSTNLYDFEQVMALKGKPVLISGLCEAGLSGIIPEKIKIKQIVLMPEERQDMSELLLGISKERLDAYLKQVKELVRRVGRKGSLSYRLLLEHYFQDENIALMMRMPATHTRQASPAGGMLHATLSVTDMAYNLAGRYLTNGNGVYSFCDVKSLDWDLLITGGLMHLAGNFLYFEKEPPHRKRAEGVEQGFSACRQQYILKLVSENDIPMTDEELSALFGVMSRLNEQKTGINKCRQESAFLYAAYQTFHEMDSFDAEIYEVLKRRFEEKGGVTAYDFSESLGCYISKTEIERKEELLGLKKNDTGGEKNAK